MSVAMLITSYNRAPQLSRTLQRLRFLTKPDEIIVVDDGSRDETESVCRQAVNDWGLNLKYVYRHFPLYDSCAVPRNIGLKMVESEYVITCEPEILYVNDVVRVFLDCSKEYPDDVITQKAIYFMDEYTERVNELIVHPKEIIASWIVEESSHTGRARKRGTVTLDHPISPFTAMYKTQWLLDIGGWDEDMSIANGGGGWGWDDIDLLTRLRIKGHNQQFPEEAVVVHQWHDRPPNAVVNRVQLNYEVMMNKNLSVDGHEDPQHPLLVANKDREWGAVKCTNKHHEFCAWGYHCHTCEPEKANINHNCVWGINQYA